MSNLILLVEDVPFQFRSLRDELTEAGWEVLHARDEEDALFRLRTLQEEGKRRIDVAAIDLGLPPDKDNPLKFGMQLIAKLRAQKNYEDLPILAYTALATFDYAAVARRLLNFRASFICLRPMGEDIRFVDILEYVRKGYLLLSQTPASYLPSTVLDQPDPLDDKLWETLAKLNSGLTQNQVAELLNVASDTVKTRIERAKEILTARKELPFDARTDELLAWYREHKVRYGRD